ncbi:MAG TPA: LacI family DNA-binding transcriptional regulator, partial [Mycobacteriales bacterium]|nr:LacI family DNA-binding transcriptional regulator [Mycobacteriales bacterium]
MTRRVTRQDVALRAGVSGAAVSVVLNGARGNIRIAPKTRERIIAAARELDYVANTSAQDLRRQRSLTLGVVGPPPPRTTYQQVIGYQLSYFIRTMANRRGYEVFEVAEHEAETPHENPVRTLANRSVAGILVVSNRHHVAELRTLLAGGMPMVQLLRPQLGRRCPSVVVDPRSGIAEAVAHLAGLGHRRIAYVGSGSAHVTDRGRFEAFQRAMGESGIALPERFVRLQDYGLDFGAAALRALLAYRRAPTAVFCGADVLALGVLRAAYAARVRIPEELSVISYDDVLASGLYPALTAVSQPLQAVAERSVEALVERIEGGRSRTALVLPTHL